MWETYTFSSFKSNRVVESEPIRADLVSKWFVHTSIWLAKIFALLYFMAKKESHNYKNYCLYGAEVQIITQHLIKVWFLLQLQCTFFFTSVTSSFSNPYSASGIGIIWCFSSVLVVKIRQINLRERKTKYHMKNSVRYFRIIQNDVYIYV